MTVYHCDRTATPQPRGAAVVPQTQKTSAPSALSAVKPDPVPNLNSYAGAGCLVC